MKDRASVQVTRVIDGDTVEVRTKPGFLRKSTKKRVRLYGIDAPESAQKGGKAATKHLSKIIGSGRNVWLDTSGTDQYGRAVGLLYHRHGNPAYSYNYQMVEAGHAHCYLLSAKDRAHYLRAQKEAQRNRRGLWNQEHPTPPWEWRKEKARKPFSFPWRLALTVAILLLLAAVLLHGPDLLAPIRPFLP